MIALKEERFTVNRLSLSFVLYKLNAFSVLRMKRSNGSKTVFGRDHKPVLSDLFPCSFICDVLKIIILNALIMSGIDIL